MAFDQVTRNRLQKFVGDARKLLSEEFIQQLQNTYGLDPVTGAIAELSALPALSPSEQQTATLLRDTLGHYLAASHETEPHRNKKLVIAALDRVVREQAFTVLNRLAALRMAEARQFLMESISQGYQSKGFQLYQRIAGSSLGETGKAYQYYLFSVFDELSLDLAVLFDRYSNQGRLFPRETVLLELLGLINHAELEMLWAEDETVGWIYQYFNSKEERKKMRDESQAPRNSRELAVRNQFFTPRYVVEFLTDNTLGRIWYEMTQGNTALVDSCQYLVRRPNEMFLKVGEQAPKQDEQDTAELSQAELLQQTVYIEHRPIKDPRDIRMLDPACGSMHFGLYAFDLFEQIYTEAWDIEAEKGRGIFFIEEGAVPKDALHEAYSSKENYLADVPRLIIEHNIHGVDIDPRAAQIAGLSLWLRAQKSWSDNAIKPNQRPKIQRSNIVCAEPMPGETQLLKEFTSQIQPRVLGQLVEEIFDKMQLAGEAGTLLKIEEEIQVAIDDAKSQKDEKVLEVQGGLFSGNKWEVREGKRYYNFGDVSENFWGEAEQLILSQLELYAEAATGSGLGQKRLFAADAAKGFAFIDLCRKKYDVVLMNPPFGEFSERHKVIADSEFTSGGHEISSSFVERCLSMQFEGGRLGCISSRAIFFGVTTKNWREYILNNASVSSWVELGAGVLDDAMVETSMYVLENSDNIEDSLFSKNINSLVGFDGTRKSEDVYLLDARSFLSLNAFPFSYWLHRKLFKAINNNPSLSESGINVKVGLQSGDDFRFVRTWFEVDSKPSWVPYSKGGDNSPFCSDVHLKVFWANKGHEVSSHKSSVTRNSTYYMKEGYTFSYRTSRFSPGIMPRNTIPGVAGMGIYVSDDLDLFSILALLNSSVVNEIISTRLGRMDSASLYQAGVISPTPLPIIPKFMGDELSEISKKLVSVVRNCFSASETSRYFVGIIRSNESFDKQLEEYQCQFDLAIESLISGYKDIDRISLSIYSFPDAGLSKWKERFEGAIRSTLMKYRPNQYDFLSYFVGKVFGRWADISESIIDLLDCPDVPVNLISVDEGASVIEMGFGVSKDLSDLVMCEASKYCKNDPSEEFERAGISNVQSFIQKPNGFFAYHLKKYSLSKRSAPIYWPLSTKSSSYTLWVYYPRINSQTLYFCINNLLEPKIESVVKEVNLLRKMESKGGEEERRLSDLIALEVELKDFKDGLELLAGVYKPNFDDGVLLCAAPLFKHFQLTAWKDNLHAVWKDLEDGKYDWSKMAFNFWPNRVLERCFEDRSMAISHGVEDDLWEEIEVSGARGKGTKLKWQPKEMTEAELDAYIKNKIAQG
ncbi:BREX-1 system adenine-specific DNA-methyltransferase PglX [uncultured Amphritea sp.]|uniref:BREX-1 system adenine-specific DNA-methyltransferase PglX n=1 Tax=uncultured Amphritea sp. TaxID=981605 RepID=UPI0026128880|nr:BREX-1 system adenine-specific DNA-methyltransferase PglX [uncultured Amphritea sp.]